jgi:hypothetical protein
MKIGKMINFFINQKKGPLKANTFTVYFFGFHDFFVSFPV